MSMEPTLPKALTVPREGTAQCPSCLSINFQRHLPQTRWRAQGGAAIIECATCKQQYSAPIESQRKAA